MTKLDQSLITELKTLMKKKDIYRLVSLDDVLAGQSGYTILQCRILKVKECEELNRNWTYVSSTNNRQKLYKSGGYHKFIFLGCCRSSRVFVVRIKSRAEANMILQRESFLSIGSWAALLEGNFENEKLGKRETFVPILSTSYPLMELDDIQDYVMPSSKAGFPLLRSASLAEGSMSMFWFSVKKIDVYRARYLRNTCPNVFCDRTVSLGYVGSSTRTVCKVCSSSMHSEAKYSIAVDMGFSSDGDVVRTTLSGRKLCGIFIDKTLVDLSWEEFSSKVNNKLEKLVVAARDITEIINECPTSYWMVCGWVMYGQTVNSSGEIIVSNFKKAHVIDLIPCMTPETREIVESKMIKGDMVTSSTPNHVPDGSDADNGGPSDAQ